MSLSLPESAGGVRPARLDELPEIARLAGIIWKAHYSVILSPEQIEFMLRKMYSLEQLRQDVGQEGIGYWVAKQDENLIGFAAAGPTPTASVYKLHKLYVHPEHHRQGWGKKLLSAVMAQVRTAGGSRLILCVNKRNEAALQAYAKYGFRRLDSVCTPIGQGFVMDDFLLGLDIP